MLRVVAVLFCGAALLSVISNAQSAQLQGALEERLSSDRLGRADAGSYLAGDQAAFTLDPAGANYLLSIDGTPEVFVLHPDSASMGGRILKYDSGETALLVSGWGALTLYTDSAPGGLPAVRTGDFVPPLQTPVSLGELQGAAEEDTAQLAEIQHLSVSFRTDWAALSSNIQARVVAFEALENVARGIERFCGSPHGRNALARRLTAVTLAIAGRPTVTLEGKTLIVTFNPDMGYEGRASSRSISLALGSLFSAPRNQS